MTIRIWKLFKKGGEVSMKNGVTITIYVDGDLYEYRYDADVKWELKTNLDARLEQYLRFKAMDCIAFMQEEGQ